MSQAPYSWTFVGPCAACGSPIYGRVRKPGWEDRTEQALEADEPEARRTCPPSCPYGAKGPAAA